MSIDKEEWRSAGLEDGHNMRDFQYQRTRKIQRITIGVLAIACIILTGLLIRQSTTPNDVFRHVPQAKAEIIHTPGVMPPILGPECMLCLCV
jgi:hypothetical protein